MGEPSGGQKGTYHCHPSRKKEKKGGKAWGEKGKGSQWTPATPPWDTQEKAPPVVQDIEKPDSVRRAFLKKEEAKEKSNTIASARKMLVGHEESRILPGGTQ